MASNGIMPALNPAEVVYFISLYFFNYFVLQLVSKLMELMVVTAAPDTDTDTGTDTTTVETEKTATFTQFFTLLFYILSVVALGFITLQSKGSTRPATFSGMIVAIITIPSSLGSFNLFDDAYAKYLVPLAITLITNYYIG